jgi:GTP cyclohydrolase I
MDTQSDKPHELRREYDENFVVTPEYRESLPDVQNSGAKELEGARVPILQVGISGFRLPLEFVGPDGEALNLETCVTGTVSLEADKEGINMSRIIRIFYEYKKETFSPEVLSRILKEYKERLDSKEARLKANFSYPMLQESLRSGLQGFQFYDCCFEGIIDCADRVRKIIHFDFVYSSACPCASELSEHAREKRNLLAIPHSQRSKARISVEVHPDKEISLLDLRDLCINGLSTETQVMVRREDEQAFAELNGAKVKFVEDAARLLFSER